MNIQVIAKDFNPNSEDFKNEVDAFKRGVSWTVSQFRKHELSKKVLDNMNKRSDETDAQYVSRLRGDLVDAMCSNAGYASCFDKVKP